MKHLTNLLKRLASNEIDFPRVVIEYNMKLGSRSCAKLVAQYKNSKLYQDEIHLNADLRK